MIALLPHPAKRCAGRGFTAARALVDPRADARPSRACRSVGPATRTTSSSARNDPQPSPRLPDPDSVPSKGPVKSNPYLTGAGALAAMATPCPISRNCVVGFGPPIVPMIKGAVDLAKRAFAKKPDKTGRVAIPLDAADPPTGTLRALNSAQPPPRCMR